MIISRAFFLLTAAFLCLFLRTVSAGPGDILPDDILQALYQYEMDDALALCDACTLDNETILSLKSTAYYLMADRDKKEEYYDKAEALIRQVDPPTTAIGHTAWALHYSVEANRSGFLDKADLAGEAFDHAQAALELDTNMAHAHFIIGRYYYAVSELNPIKRNLARGHIDPDVFENATYENACRHLEAAARLVPERFLYVYYAGACRYNMGDEEAALRYFEKAKSLNLSTPSDLEERDGMMEMLEKLRE